MARRTKIPQFRELVADARKNISNLNITTDIIVGFPGETADDFRESYDFVEEIGFSRLHAFPYSARPGTAAADMPDHLTKDQKKARMRKMLDLGNKMGADFHSRYVGKKMNVLWEQVHGADDQGLRWSGYSDNYMRVQAHGPADLLNTVSTIEITSADSGGVQGHQV